MTIEALRQLDLIAQDSPHAGFRVRAKKIADILREEIKQGRMPATLQEAGIESSEFENPTFSQFTIDSDRKLTNLTGQEINVTRHQRDILFMFMRHSGEVVDVVTASSEVPSWQDFPPDDLKDVLKNSVKDIRNILSPLGLKSEAFPGGYLVNVRGKGYSLADPTNPDHVEKYSMRTLRQEP